MYTYLSAAIDAVLKSVNFITLGSAEDLRTEAWNDDLVWIRFRNN
jgi:hypothetical protein